MSAQGTAGQAAATADRAGDSDGLENLARVGLLAYGLVHVLVAWLAVQLLWADRSTEADQSGAMSALAESTVGRALLWVVGAGLVALAVWQAAEVLHCRFGWSATGKQRAKAAWKTVKSLAKAVVYGGLAVSAFRFAAGSGQSSAQSQQETTSGVFAWPGGRWLVAIAGAVLIGVGVQHVYKGVTKSFLKQIDLADAPPTAVRVITRLGRVGFPAKGVALALAGGLLAYAALTFDASKARGLDAAMHTILAAPLGGVLLVVVALGIAAFGAFLFARARYPERT